MTVPEAAVDEQRHLAPLHDHVGPSGQAAAAQTVADPGGARKPQANADYWRSKIDRNRARDARVAAELSAAGWRVLTMWECALREPGFAEALIAAVRDDQAAAISAVSEPSFSTWDRAPSREPGVSGLETK